MSDRKAAAPAGAPLISDEARQWIGREYPACEVTITARDIQKYSFATGETNPIHIDTESARAAGYLDIVAPPTFYLAIQCGCYFVMPTDQLRPDGTTAEDFPPLPLERVRAGEVKLEYHGDIVAGDTLRVTRRFRDMYEKVGRSGPLIFLEFEYRFERAGETVLVETYTRILS